MFFCPFVWFSRVGVGVISLLSLVYSFARECGWISSDPISDRGNIDHVGALLTVILAWS